MEENELSAKLAAHRREIVSHCYRMLGTAPDAEDATQDALVKAWQARDSLREETALRPWLYRIATRVCLDLAAKRGPRVLPNLAFPPADAGTPPRPFLEDSIWVGPFPDADAGASPGELHEKREHVALAFIAALQHLPPKQRATLLLRDVVELSAKETAEALESTPAAIEAALQRARTTLATRRAGDEVPSPGTDAPSRELLERYVAAWHARDPNAFVALLTEDASFVMPPTPVWFQGREAVGAFVAARLREQAFRLEPLRANGGPAFALYREAPDGSLAAHGIQVLELREGAIAAIHTFLSVKDDRSFRAFGVPTSR